MISRKKRESSSNWSKRHYLALFIIFWLHFGYFQDLVGTLQGGCFFHLLHPQNFDHDRSAWTSSCRWTSSWNHHSGKKKLLSFFSKTIFIHFVLFLFLGQTRHYGRPICPQCPFVQIGQLLGNGSSPRNLLGCQPWKYYSRKAIPRHHAFR